jgi:hypothetical protein
MRKLQKISMADEG